MASKKQLAAFTMSGVALVSLLSGAFIMSQSGASAKAYAASAKSVHGTAVSLTYVGEGSFGTGTLSSDTTTYSKSLEIGPQAPEDDTHQMTNTPIKSTSAVGHVATSSQTTINAPSSSVVSFAGLNNYQNRYASHGNQFDLEPPDQGLCVGNGFLIEGVNDVMAAYSTNGAHQNMVGGYTGINEFFGVAPEIVRTHKGGSVIGTNGPFISDPKCYYDAGLNRWFFTSLEIDVDPATGSFTNSSHEYIAVSKTSSPVGKYYVYKLDTTDASAPNCPCFGDQPLIGADANGFYLTSNEFPISGPGFNGAQVYAFPKAALAAGGAVNGVHINAGAIPTPQQTQADQLYGIWYSIQPATTPPGGAYERANNGTEYFMSALDFGSFTNLAGDNRVAVWAMTNTGALSSTPTAVSLTYTIVNSQFYIATYNTPYGFAATQKSGPTPLGDYFANVPNAYCPTASGANGTCGPQGLEMLNANDDRMNQVVYADGNLWSGVNTIVYDPASGTYPVGIAYFVAHPSDSAGTLSATMTNDGYVTAGQDNVLFPSLGVNAQGRGIVSFTLSGPDYYPSAAYTTLNAGGTGGAITVAGAGVGPEDGFTGYPAIQYSPYVSRWGDYSAAFAAPDGSIWAADETINQSCGDTQFNADNTCGGTRTFLANWGTYVYQVKP